ncbi:MAG TPA: hypothetical protein VJ717_16240 [Gemmatimonadaceae bacterium]|nr:hypothetical protein [Gemmatimonadaceae bacterium]
MTTFEGPKVPSEEPIGIVISCGAAVVAVPRVIAYVWGEAPDGDDGTTRAKR